MQTTLKEIIKHNPCNQDGDAKDGGWKLLLKNLGKTEADDEPLDLMTILESNGIKDAVWPLRCFDYLDYCLFLADVAESVLPIFEKKYPDDNRPRLAIQTIRDYKEGKISKEQLKPYAAYAADVADAAAYDDAAYSAYAAAYAAVDDAAYAAYATAYAAADAAYAYAYATYAYASNNTWDEIEELFIKHFCGGDK